MESVMKQIYQEPSREGSFGGINTFFHAVRGKASKKEVKEFFRGQNAYTLHKLVRRTFPRNRVFVHKTDYQWQADLADVSNLK